MTAGRGASTAALALCLACLGPFTRPGAATEPSIDEILAAPHRDASSRARDVYRHPKETLEFFGLRPDMTVAEMLPGRGWYTEILAPLLCDRGELVVASYGADNDSEFLRAMHNDFVAKLDAGASVYDRLKHGIVQPGKAIDLGPAGSADMVLTFPSTHNWIRYGGLDAVYAAMFEVLKPGGVLGVVQHRGRDGWTAADSAEQGYVPQSYLVAFLERIGFVFVASSEINANAADTKDYPEGVWTLPPSYRLAEVDRERYRAIGESDRMTLKFVKPGG